MQPSRSLLIFAAALHVLLMWAAFAPVNLWPLIFLAPAPLAWLAVRAPSTRFAVVTAIGAHLVLWTAVSIWMIQVTELGFPFYVLAMAGWNGGMFVWVFRRIHQTPKRPNVQTSKGGGGTASAGLDVGRSGRFDVSRLPMALTLPIVWIAIEALRGEFIADGYPWYFLAHPIVEAPILAQTSDLFGAYFISFLAAMVSGAALDVMRAWNKSAGSQVHESTELRPRTSSPVHALITLAIVLLIHSANFTYGAWRLSQTQPLSEGPALLVVQTNLPQDNKMRWTAEDKIRDFRSFLELTAEGFRRAGGAGRPIDVIVWPETMLPGFGLERDTLEFLKRNDYDVELYFSEQIIFESDAAGVPILTGSPAVIGLGTEPVDVDGHSLLKWTWESQYNSAYLIQGVPPYQRYDKVFLTPFGETMPYISKWPALEQRLLAIGARGMSFDLDPGDAFRILNLEWRGGSARLATPICFEVTVGWVNRRLVYAPGGEKRADVLVNLTNDGWFGFYGPGRVQHAQMSRYRAIENRVPMVRAANTGVSVSIDSSGRLVDVIGSGPYGEPKLAGHLYTQVSFDARATLYGRIGDLWAWLCVGTAAVLLMASWVRLKRRSD